MNQRLTLTLSKLLEGYFVVDAAEDRPLFGLTLDSGSAWPGEVFCALRGSRQHGLAFAAEAVNRGAVAVLVETDPAWPAASLAALRQDLAVPVFSLAGLSRHLSHLAGRFYGEPGRYLDVIGVTGTNGKTSVCQFIAHALVGQTRCGLLGTLGYGFPGALSSTGFTTPDAIRLQALLAMLRTQGAGAIALEVSSHALDQGRADGVPITTAVFTNLTRDHLDYHRDMRDYALAKQRLFQQPGLQHAVLNADDAFSRDIQAALAPDVEAVLYSIDPHFIPPASGRYLHATAVTPDTRGLHLVLASSWGQTEVWLPLLGRFNAANILAALCVVLLRGIPLETALLRLTKVPSVPGRMECFGQPGQPLVVVDYAHSPDALEQVLTVLRGHQPRRLIALFGCGGERDRGKRPQMGAVAERLGDMVILTDDNPRSEEGAAIVDEILSGIRAPAAITVRRDRALAIRYAIGQAGPEDIVLVAGKGHETTQQIGTIYHPFSDRAVVTQALNEWGLAERGNGVGNRI